MQRSAAAQCWPRALLGGAGPAAGAQRDDGRATFATSPGRNAFCRTAIPTSHPTHREQTMSKSGQPATKADTGGQRVPKSTNGDSGRDKKPVETPPPVRKASGKRPHP